MPIWCRESDAWLGLVVGKDVNLILASLRQFVGIGESNTERLVVADCSESEVEEEFEAGIGLSILYYSTLLVIISTRTKGYCAPLLFGVLCLSLCTCYMCMIVPFTSYAN